MFRLTRNTGALLVAFAAVVLFAGAACNDDGDGDAERESAADLTAKYENFTRDLLATSDIKNAPNDTKDGLKDDCGDLQDQIDSDDLDDFCGDLGDAIDDEDKAAFDAVKARSGEVKAALDDEIRDRVADAAGDNDGDDPLEGGDDNNDDANDKTQDATDDDVDNPLDSDDNDGDDSGN
mgnify:CR=1 FL=1